MSAVGPLVARWLALERTPVEAGPLQPPVVEAQDPRTAVLPTAAGVQGGARAAGGGGVRRERGLRGRADPDPEPDAPGGGGHPRFPPPLVSPSPLPPLEPTRVVAGLPASAPDGAEPWMFDGRLT